jgi:hypothetical protein
MLAVLWIGLAGVHGDGDDGSSTTYYDTRLALYYKDLREGGYVIDKSVPLGKNPGLAVKSPMCKGCLNPGIVDRMPDPSESIVAQAIAREAGNPASHLAKLALATAGSQFGGFDFVAPDLYAAWWLAHGARVGVRVGGTIVWNDGTSEEIQ